MPTPTPSPSPGQRSFARLSRALMIATAVAGLMAGLLFFVGERMQAEQERRRAAVVEGDDREFCSKLGIEPLTRLYPECRAGLREIRLRHEQRSADFFH